MIDPSPSERAALAELQAALVRGETLAPDGQSAGARRKALRERLDGLAGKCSDFASPDEWLAAREEALTSLRRSLGRSIEELRGEQERLLVGLGRWFPPARARELQGQRVRLILDLLEILGRLAELRDMRREITATPPPAAPGDPSAG